VAGGAEIVGRRGDFRRTEIVPPGSNFKKSTIQPQFQVCRLRIGCCSEFKVSHYDLEERT